MRGASVSPNEQAGKGAAPRPCVPRLSSSALTLSLTRRQQHPLLDGLLFRLPPPSKPYSNNPPTLLPVLPIFAELDMLDIDREDYSTNTPKWYGDDCNCDNAPHYVDYATSPACKVIDVHILDFKPRRAWGSAEDGGVTVGDVLHAVLFTWDDEFREKGITRGWKLRERAARGEIWRGFAEARAMKMTTHFWENPPPLQEEEEDEKSE